MGYLNPIIDFSAIKINAVRDNLIDNSAETTILLRSAGSCARPVVVFYPKQWQGHPANNSFPLSRKVFSGEKYPQHVWFHLKTEALYETGCCVTCRSSRMRIKSSSRRRTYLWTSLSSTRWPSRARRRRSRSSATTCSPMQIGWDKRSCLFGLEKWPANSIKYVFVRSVCKLSKSNDIFAAFFFPNPCRLYQACKARRTCS